MKYYNMLQIKQYFMQMNDSEEDDEDDDEEEICVVCGGNCSGCGKCQNKD